MQFQKFIILLFIIIFYNPIFGQQNKNTDSVYYKKAVKYYHSNPDSALFFVKEIINDSTTSKYYTAKAYLLGGVLYKNIGKIDSSYFFYHTSEKIFTELNDNIGLASVKNNLARLYHQSGKLDLALEAFLESVSIFELEKDSVNMAETYTNLGDLYLELKQKEKGLNYLNKAKEIFIANNNKIGEAFILTNIGLLKEENNQIDSALFYFLKSLDILTNADREKLYADCCVKLGRIYLKKKDSKKAKYFYTDAEKKYKKVDFPLGIAKCKYGMGNYFLSWNKENLAIKNYNSALKIAKEVDASSLQKEILFKLYSIHKKRGNVKKSLTYFEDFTKLKDSIFGIETVNNVAIIQAKNEFQIHQSQLDKLHDSAKIQKLLTEKLELVSEKRKIGIIVLIISIATIIFILGLLYYRYQEKNKLNKSLSISLNEREVLLKELHHRVKNNLQIISSLLNLQKKFKANKSVDEIIEISRNRIATMVSVHEKLYRSKSLKDVDIKEYTEELISNVASSFSSEEKDVKISVSSEDIKVEVNKLIPYGLILNELITNSFKHAFANKKDAKFEVYISEENKLIIIDVKDNGKGLPDNFDFSQSNSLGMKLINGLAEQINGKFETLKTQIGTHFRISFKR